MIQSLRYKALALSEFVGSEKRTETEYAIRALSLQKTDIAIFAIKNLEEKDGQTQLLCYVSLIRACNKVL